MTKHGAARMWLALGPVWWTNVGAFWLAELVVSPGPVEDEVWWVTGIALVAYLLYAAAARLGWAAAEAAYGQLTKVSHTPIAPEILAFGPGTLLLLPRMRVALTTSVTSTTVRLALVSVACGALLWGWSRARGISLRGRWVAYAWSCLCIWVVALPLANLPFEEDVTKIGVASSSSQATIVGTVCLLWTLILLRWEQWGRRLWNSRIVAAHGIVAAVVVTLVLVNRTERIPTVPSAVAQRGAPHAAPAGAPPIVLIVMDTTRADHLSVYGYPRNTTPELERLARDAVVYEHAYSTSSWTLPAHASLFTGLFPSAHGAHHWQQHPDDTAAPLGRFAWGKIRTPYPLKPEHLTVAEWLSDNGYTTAAIASNFLFLHPEFGLAQGFSHYDSRENAPTKWILLEVLSRRIVFPNWLERVWLPYRSASTINDAALGWIQEVPHDRFFLFLNYMEPHLPNPAGLRYADFRTGDSPARTVLTAHGRIATNEQRDRIDLYDSEIASLDKALGDLFNSLRQTGLYDRSLIIVTSDHGESLGEHGIDGHAKSLYEPEIKIPLLIKYPFSRERGRRSQPVQLTDIWPVIAGEIGLENPDGFVKHPLQHARDLVTSELEGDPNVVGMVYYGYQVAIIRNGIKAIVYGDDTEAIFDLRRDRTEGSEVTENRPDWIDARLQELAAWRREASARTGSGPDMGVDEQTARRMKSLGYL